MNNKKLTIGIVVVLILVAGGWLLFRGNDSGSEVSTEDFVENIVGAWRNVEYTGLVREFKERGFLTDRVGNDVIEGRWVMFDGISAPEIIGMNFDEEGVYLKINLTGEEKSDIYFEVNSVTADVLELRYFDRAGSAMNFTRED